MKNLKCPVCEKDYTTFIDTYISSWNFQEYKLYHCENCSLQWWEPLEIIAEFYEEEVLLAYKYFHAGVRELQAWHKPFFKHFPRDKKGVLLDIGCGDGVFLKEVKKLGFEVWGIDLDKKSIKTAREKFGLMNTYPMFLEEFSQFAEESGLKFDVITFFEVLEHQDNPQNFIKNVKKLLKPNGYIAGTVPNRDRPLVALDRRYANTADFPPHHFLYFNRDSLRFLLRKFNFEDIFFSPVEVNFNSVNTLIELIITMGWSRKLSKMLKNSVIDEGSMPVSSYEKIYGKSKRVKLLRFLKTSRDLMRLLVFLPFSMPLYFLINSKGAQIYFQAKLKE